MKLTTIKLQCTLPKQLLQKFSSHAIVWSFGHQSFGEQLIFNMGEIPFSRCHNHPNFMSHCGKFWAAGVLEMLASPTEGQPKMGSAETPDVSPQLMSGGGAEMPSLLHCAEQPHSRTQFLLSSSGGWCLGWRMVPWDHRSRLQLNGTHYSFCAPTLLFHTNFWKISSSFCSPVFLKMTISRKPALSITLIWCPWSFCICDWEDAV